MLKNVYLQQRLKEICSSGATLLWLEGTKHQTVASVRLSGNRLILQLDGNLLRVITFDRYTTTKVGLQFWSKGHPGVLYRWDQVPAGSQTETGAVRVANNAPTTPFHFDDEPPPRAA